MTSDPIWNLPARMVGIGSGLNLYVSDRAGRFAVGEGLAQYLKDWTDKEKANLTGWILNHNRAGDDPVLQPVDMSAIRTRSPIGFSEKIDRFLLMLRADNFTPGDLLPWRTGVETPETVRARHRTMFWIEASSEKEFYAFRSMLVDTGHLISGKPDGAVRLGPRAYERLDQLRSVGGSPDQGFVAMWFDNEVCAAYDDGIQPGLEDAGYRPLRIDRKEHNNKIDDEILAEIRRSRFMVADFTCGIAETDRGKVAIARGGVYYEAGFAQGLGIPVIWCVRSDQVEHVHFDTRQFNHIVWTTPEELRQKLTSRIAASLGWGPHR